MAAWLQQSSVLTTLWTIINSVGKQYAELQSRGRTYAWHKIIWNPIVRPIHAFITWLATHRKPLTADRFADIMGRTAEPCCLCGVVEATCSHWFLSVITVIRFGARFFTVWGWTIGIGLGDMNCTGSVNSSKVNHSGAGRSYVLSVLLSTWYRLLEINSCSAKNIPGYCT